MKRIVLFLLLLLPFVGIAQTAPVGDCLGAIPICQQVYSETTSPTGGGNVLEINDDFNCMRVELNSIWYSFTVNQSGDFGFLLTPNAPNDDYDWALFDITNASCAELFNNPDLIVSCNAAGDAACQGPTGANGGSAYSNQGFGCNNVPPSYLIGNSPFNALVPVQAGNTYVLCVSNWTGSPNGYMIDFGLSTGIGIFDETPPFIESVEVPEECFDGEFIITFSEPIQCLTIDASNFVLQHPTGTYALQLSSPSCDVGGNFSKTFRLQADPGLFGLSNYTLQLIPSTNFPVLDLCGNPAAAEDYPFSTGDFMFEVDLGPDGIFCLSQPPTLDATTPQSSYLWQDGSTANTFTVNDPGQYAVTVSSSCGTRSDTVEFVSLDELPPVDLGPDQILCPGETVTLDATTTGVSYLWQDGSSSPTINVDTPGTYSVTITSDCEVKSDTVFIDYYPPITATLDEIGICLGDTLTLDVTTPFANYQWQDGTENPLFQVTEPGDYAVTITTPCETTVLEATIQLITDAPSVELSTDTLVCAGDSLVLDVRNVGATYSWADGRSDSVLVVRTAGTYAVTVSNACGEAIDAIDVDFRVPLSIDLPLDTFLCPGERLLFDASHPEATVYQWSDGSTAPLLVVEEPAQITVTLQNNCEQLSHSINIRWCEQCEVYVPNAFSPNDDGFNDRFLPLSDCPFFDYTFQIFDRWGGLVFETKNPELGWDGTRGGDPLPTGIYVWVANLTVVEEGIPRRQQLTGDVALLR
jgi:gliding motility-associated-like protein